MTDDRGTVCTFVLFEGWTLDWSQVPIRIPKYVNKHDGARVLCVASSLLQDRPKLSASLCVHPGKKSAPRCSEALSGNDGVFRKLFFGNLTILCICNYCVS